MCAPAARAPARLRRRPPRAVAPAAVRPATIMGRHCQRESCRWWRHAALQGARQGAGGANTWTAFKGVEAGGTPHLRREGHHEQRRRGHLRRARATHLRYNGFQLGLIGINWFNLESNRGFVNFNRGGRGRTCSTARSTPATPAASASNSRSTAVREREKTG
jgi:hypothetical protein